MSAIKDVIDLSTQLVTLVQDRKLATELSNIQKLILKIQSEQANLHEVNIQLREERLSLMEKIQELESKIKELSSTSPPELIGSPACPNCSTNSKPFFMRAIPQSFASIMNATHECPRCKYTTTNLNPK